MTDKEKDKRRTQQKISVVKAYKRFFDTSDGQVVLKNLCKRFGFYATTFSENPYETAFYEGQRAVVLEIIKQLKLDLGALENFLKEDDNG